MHRTMILGLITCAFLLCTVPAPAQLSERGTPLTRLYPGRQVDIPVKILPSPDLGAVHTWDAANPLPYRFAVNIPCGSDLLADGKWQTMPDGSRVCLLEIMAPGAKALSLLFDSLYIPSGARFYVMSSDEVQVLGAYTSRNNSHSGKFAVQLIHGDRLRLEYNEPPGANGKAHLFIGSLAYAYRGVPDPGYPDGFGGAGPCEVNVNCPEGQAYQEEKKGVVRIQAAKGGSTFWCSGSLVNNTRYDGTPYVLSADHCYKGGIPADLLQWIFYFNYDGPGCENPLKAPTERALAGATLKARGGDVGLGGSDFLLLLLNDAVPDTLDLYLNGWSRKNTPAVSGVGIHHPQGDIKKISTFTQKTSSTSWLGGNIYTHWLVTWSETPNGHGVTEGGSSGSALFDSAGMIIGSLTGGGSACDSALLNEPDYYGKFSYSWVSCGPDSASQLKPWLDPDDTGVEVLDGKPLSVHNTATAGTISVFPNPTRGIFTVDAAKLQIQGPVNFTLFDCRGMVLLSETRQFAGNRSEFDISSLSPGIYLLRISGRSSTLISKIVKN